MLGRLPLYSYEYSSLKGDYAFVAWNAGSGRLIQWSCKLDSQIGGSHALREAEAVALGFQWLRDLHVMDLGPGWHVVNRPMRNRGDWVIQFQSGVQRVTVNIDRNNGNLVYLNVWL